MARRKRRSTWGSKRSRGDGVWELRFRVAGEPRTETFYGTDSESDRRLAELRLQYEGVTSLTTVGGYWNSKFLPYIEKTLAPNTVRDYTSRYNVHILPEFGSDVMREIRPPKVQRWLLSMTYDSAKHCKAVLSSIFSHAVIDEVIDENIMNNRYTLPKTKGKPQNHDVYTAEELEAIFRACEGEVFEAALIMAGGGGALISEALSPKLDEISFADGFAIVPIRRSIQRNKGEVELRAAAKNEYRESDLIVLPPFAARLKELVAEGIERGDEWLTDDGFGCPACPDNISQAYKRWFQTQPFVYVPFKNLRNTYSTILHKMNFEDSLVSKLMRHANLTTDYRHYNRLSTEDKLDMLREALSYGQ